ncbi:winged helix-turn-helix domain-containing tetratricopeptide repeat protein [Dankookia sp. GCM10030260]|uniref:winged helix-turn-helix domain-containing tetratricopeptide repeat protein n=1 Tax=Dankookia sp. GCM10030260 TaxID=3273390 RepID=UPI0036214B5C
MLYRFDAFELDTGRYALRRDGAPCHVEPLVFDLLVFLLRNPGRVLGREEIVEQVWQGRAVSEATISSCVKAARRALGDSGEDPTYIRTVRGRGFEFTAQVSAQPATPDIAQAASLPATPAASLPATPAGDASPLPILAVLPFANLSAETDAYFADGLTEDIIMHLARFRDLRVIAGASSFRFKGRDVDLAEIRARLRAGYVVQGSVRRDAGRIRISAQLVDAATGLQLWGDRYDREMGDIFALQDEVTRTIAAALGVTMQATALQRALTKKPVELDAYDCLLRARRYTWMLSAEMHAEARDLLERAVELDPLSSDAHALLANVYLGEHRFEMNPRPNPIGRAMVHALAATQLDPQNAYARCWLAIVHFFRGENDRFEMEAQRALELNPNDPETLADVGHYLAFMGEFERGVALSRRAQLLNPLHPEWYLFSLARLHYSQRRYADVVGIIQRIGMPHFYWTHLLAAAALGQLGDPAAPAALARIFAVKPDFSARGELRKWNAAPDDLDHILQGLMQAGLRE